MASINPDSESLSILEQNILRYEWVRGCALDARQRGDTLKAIGWAYLAGFCGWHGHAGRYVDPTLERMLHEIGQDIPPGSGVPHLGGHPSTPFSRTRWLHVISTALPVGGHTRLVQQWIRKDVDTGACHSVILADQRWLPVPVWLREAVAQGGGNLVELHPKMKMFERVVAIRQAMAETADIVVLHTHPNDPLSVLAGAVEGLPPMILMNHAEHVFWFGASLADVVADLRPWGQQTTLGRRRARQSVLLPIPLEPPLSGTKEEARCRLGFSPDTTILLSIGSDYKYIPFGEQDFPAAVQEILRRNPSTVMVVVGPDGTGPAWSGVRESAGERLLLMGQREDIGDFYRAADIYLECYPVGSHTASLDAVLFGSPVLRAPVPPIEMLGLEDYEGMTPRASDQDTYCDQAGRLIKDSEFRRESALAQKRAVIALHGGEGWLSHRDRLLSALPPRHDSSFNLPEFTLAPDRHDRIWAELQARQEEALVLKRAYLDNSAFKSLLAFNKLKRLWAVTAGRSNYHPEMLSALKRW